MFNNAGILQEYRAKEPIKDRARGRKFVGEYRPINSDGYEFFYNEFGLSEYDLDSADVYYVPESNRYAFPVNSPWYVERGVSLRTFEKDSGFPKWDHYPHVTGEIWMGWYIQPNCANEAGPVVIVEDPISALKVSTQFICGYLNGTELNYDKLSEILKVGRKKGVRFALDKDATHKAINILKEWAFYLGAEDVTAVPLEQDLKYSAPRDIRDLFLK
jgi:hypothetical protein